MINFSNY